MWSDSRGISRLAGGGEWLRAPPAGVDTKVLAAIGAERTVSDKGFEQLPALNVVEIEQARRLRHREAESGHLAILAPDTIGKVVGHGGGMSNHRAERLVEQFGEGRVNRGGTSGKFRVVLKKPASADVT
jgi:hypothetical protein